MRLFLILLISYFFVGCSSDEVQVKEEKQQPKVTVDGSVFIVTQASENIKLALIPIKVSTLEEYEKACALVVSNLEATITKNKPLLTQNESKYQLIKIQYDLALLPYNAYKLEFDEFVSRNSGSANETLSNGWSSYQALELSRAALVESGVGKKHPKILNIDSQLELRMNQLLKLNKLAEEVNIFVDGINGFGSANLDMLQKESQQYESRIRDVIKLLHVNGPQIRSDADGKFSLELDREKDYILTGYGERKVGDSTETYNWIVPLNVARDEKSVSVFFSNTELADSIVHENRIKKNSGAIKAVQKVDIEIAIESVEKH